MGTNEGRTSKPSGSYFESGASAIPPLGQVVVLQGFGPRPHPHLNPNRNGFRNGLLHGSTFVRNSLSAKRSKRTTPSPLATSCGLRRGLFSFRRAVKLPHGRPQIVLNYDRVPIIHAIAPMPDQPLGDAARHPAGFQVPDGGTAEVVGPLRQAVRSQDAGVLAGGAPWPVERSRSARVEPPPLDVEHVRYWFPGALLTLTSSGGSPVFLPCPRMSRSAHPC